MHTSSPARSHVVARPVSAAGPLLAPGIGTFALGTREFMPMGLLPVIARGLDVSIPAVGVLVSAYAIGVLAAVPLMTVAVGHLRRRNALLVRMGLFTIGNILSLLAPDYGVLMIARLVTSLSHGAYFGLGAIVAASVVPKHRQARAMAAMFSGLTIANIGGVPAATLLGQLVGWRITFAGATGLGALAMVALALALPRGEGGAALGNAFGAAAGGAVLGLHLGYRAISVAGGVLALIGLAIALVGASLTRSAVRSAAS